MPLSAGGAPARSRPPLRFGDATILVRDVYDDQELATSQGLLRLLRGAMNTVHTSTRRYVLRRELLFRPGEPYDPELMAETERNLRGLGFLKSARVTAIDTLPDGRVPILVVVQEAWTLQAELTYSRAGSDQRWGVSLSEGNFMGQAVRVGLGVGANEDYSYASFSFGQRRLLGRPWEVEVNLADLGDGYSQAVAVERPYYALDDPWGLELRGWHESVQRRYYLSNAGPAGSDPSRLPNLHALVATRSEGVDLAWTRRLGRPGRRRIWRLGPGFSVWKLRYDLDGLHELSDGRVVDLAALIGGSGPIARDTGTIAHAYLALATQGRRYAETTYLLQYGPVEDVPLSPTAELRIGPAGRWFDGRAGDPRLRAELTARDWSRLGGGWLLLTGAGKVSLGSVEPDLAEASAVAGWIATSGGDLLRRQTRLFVEAGVGEGLAGTDAFVLGLNRGLRTLEYDGMAGNRLLRWNAEEGVILPLELLELYRIGVAAFYGGGMAWWQGEDRGPQDVRHDVGIGLRFGPTRAASAEVARLDLSWSLDEGGGPVLTAASRGLF